MSRRDLTAKQKAFFRYISSFVESNGNWPTYREIVDYFDFRSPNSVTQNLQALLKKGYLLRDGLGYKLVSQSAESSGIPIKGIITAGALQEAVESDLGSISLETIFPQLDRMYAIRVSGQSMVGADINDGDYVLLIDDDIPDGGIGAVMYNGETSLKRVYHDKRGLRLEPANPEYDNIIIEPDVFEEVRVLGRYVGHVNHDGIYKRAPRQFAA